MKLYDKMPTYGLAECKANQRRSHNSLTHAYFHFDNRPMQYTEFFEDLNFENFQKKIFDIFFYFCSKHRLWVHVRTDSPRRF